MPLALTVDNIESVPEALRGEYEQRDGGKFHLKVDGLPDVDGLRKQLKAANDESAARRHQLAAWEKVGKTPEQIDEMIAAERKKADEAALKAGKFDEVLAQKLGEAKQEADKVLGAAHKERDGALNIARKAVIGNNLANALAKAKATAEGMDLLTDRLGGRVKITFDENGDAVSTILETDGKTPLVGSGKGGLATFDDLVKEAVKSYPSLFEGTGAGGSGTDPKGSRRDAGSKTITRADFAKLPPVEQMAKMKDKWTVVE